MTRVVKLAVLAALAVLGTGDPGLRAAGATQPEPAFNTRKPWTRWWWPGNAVDEAGLTAQLEAFARAGIGGVEITPIYGALGYEDRYVDFLSPQFMARLAYVGKEARRLGLGVDMATGTGWPFGGPWVNTENALERIVLRDGALAGAPTGMRVKRAAPGGEGLVINPFSVTALDAYLARFDEPFASLPTGLLRGQFHDSFEYGDASWTATLPAVFREMHGYDIQEHAAELLGTKPMATDTLGRLKSDYRETLSRMHRDFLAEWKRWSHAHGFIVRNQAHGAPANLLDLYGVADIAETEVFGSTPFPIPGLRRDDDAVRHDQSLPQPLVTRMASSASHVMGHPLTSSETATWLRDHWKVALSYAKPEIDRIFLDGINHVFYHGTVYSPQDAPWPGWFFYAATQFNPNNPWWDDFPALNNYVERVQTMLQRGEPDNRVLVYWAIYDEWDDPAGLARQFSVHNADFVMGSPTGKLARKLDDAGYAFDYVSDEQIAMTSTRGGALRTPGNTYDVLVVPRAERMPLATLEKLIALAAGGAKIVFEDLPADVPGYGRLDERRAAFLALRARLSFTASARAGVQRAAVGNGILYRGDVLASLAMTGTALEALAATPIDFIRRRTADGYDYFLANLEGVAFAGWVDLGVPAAWVRITDPLTGRTGVATVKPAETSTGSAKAVRPARIYLQLRPGESLLIATSSSNLTVEPRWEWLEPAGAPIPLNGRWTIEFLKGGPDLPAPLVTSTLASWTTLGGAAAERFAGTARYRIEFDAPAVAAVAWRLNLGDVRDSARVRLNGHELATAWSLPLELRVDDALVRGRNVLEVEVTNVAANRIRDLDRRGVNWKIMREINIVNVRYEQFDASNWRIEPAGLLSPVTLVPLRRVELR